MWSLLLHILGVEPRTPSTAYNFWSGVGSDLTEFAILGAAWHHFACHDQGCWRWGKHVRVDGCGVHVRACKRHLPKGATCE